MLHVFEHYLKTEIRKRKLRLWQIRHLLGGHPSESKLSRMLNGIEPMPRTIEIQINFILAQLENT